MLSKSKTNPSIGKCLYLTTLVFACISVWSTVDSLLSTDLECSTVGQANFPEFQVESTVLPNENSYDGTLITFRIQFFNKTSNSWQPLPKLALGKHHGRLVHLVVVSEDLDTFIHFHPEDFITDLNPSFSQEQSNDSVEATFTARLDLPKPGKYLAVLDYMVKANLVGVWIAEEQAHHHKQEGGVRHTMVEAASRIVVCHRLEEGKMERPDTWDPREIRTFRAHKTDGQDRFIQSTSMLRSQWECCPELSLSGKKCIDGPFLSPFSSSHSEVETMGNNQKPKADDSTSNRPSDGCYTASMDVDTSYRWHVSHDGRLVPSTLAGWCSVLSFNVNASGATNARNGTSQSEDAVGGEHNNDALGSSDLSPVALSPYLEAAAHLFVVSTDLTWALHTHAAPTSPPFSDISESERTSCELDETARVLNGSFSSPVKTLLRIPNPGLYQVYISFAHEGRVLVTSFTLAVMGDTFRSLEFTNFEATGNCQWSKEHLNITNCTDSNTATARESEHDSDSASEALNKYSNFTTMALLYSLLLYLWLIF